MEWHPRLEGGVGTARAARRALGAATALAWLLAGALTCLAANALLSPETQKKLDSLPDNTTRIDFLRGELAKKPRDYGLRFSLGNLYFDQGQLDSAVAHLKMVSEQKPEFIGGWLNLGSVYDELGQLDQAVVAYGKALAIDSKDEKTLCNLGGVYFKKRQIDKALENFKSALLANPRSQLAHYNIAILFADAGIYREAKVEWQKAVDLDKASDLGQRSAENIKIIEQLESTETPKLPSGTDKPPSPSSGG